MNAYEKFINTWRLEYPSPYIYTLMEGDKMKKIKWYRPRIARHPGDSNNLISHDYFYKSKEAFEEVNFLKLIVLEWEEYVEEVEEDSE